MVIVYATLAEYKYSTSNGEEQFNEEEGEEEENIITYRIVSYMRHEWAEHD